MAMNDTYALYEKYGDKIVLSIVVKELENPSAATEEELRAAARSFAAKFGNPNKPCQLSFYSDPAYTGSAAFREELYKASRIACCGE